jgi:predicted DCC family thiol-disulfide oxidoreductase YuxK
LNPLLRHYLRIDARSLGLFRLAMGAVLLGDLARRFRWLDDFYTNDGVLPNHNHLFNLRGGPGVWSAFHAVSSDGEAAFGFGVVALVYVLFLLGVRTRVFHAVSLVALVSLAARNTLLEGPGTYLGIALLLVTLPLPLGSRFSIDALRESMRRATEKSPAAIRAYTPPSQEVVDDARVPGWSPLSLGAVLVTAQLALLHLALYLQHNGPGWKDGTAIARGLEATMLASERGFAMRDSALLGPLTHFVHYGPALVAVLLLVPFARGPVRALTMVLIALHGLVWATLFNYGLFGWSLVASSFLVISEDGWNGLAKRYVPERARTVIFDADCGICGWLAKLLARLDTAGHMTIQGNDELEHLLVRKSPHGDVEKAPVPAKIDAKLADSTVIAVRPDGTFVTRAAAVSEILRGIPTLRWLGFFIAIPGIHQVVDFFYGIVAKRRHAISAELGMGVCGLPLVSDTTSAEQQAAEEAEGETATYRSTSKKKATPDADDLTPSPFDRARRRWTGGLREIFALVVLGSVLCQTAKMNTIGMKLPEWRPLLAIAHYTRTLADWKILAPDAPSESTLVVTDASLRNDANIDLFTDEPPNFGLDRPFTLGELWATYFDNIRKDQNEPYIAAFRTYLSKGGPRAEIADVNQRPLGVDAYWLSAPTGGGNVEQKRLLRHGRGGPAAADFNKNAPAREFTPKASRLMKPR